MVIFHSFLYVYQRGIQCPSEPMNYRRKYPDIWWSDPHKVHMVLVQKLRPDHRC